MAHEGSGPQLLKSFDAGTLGTDEYATLSGFSKGSSTHTESIKTVPQQRRKRVIIVGAGVNGIQQATTLLRDGNVTLDNIQIFDALDGYGGVWQKNRYPGCACDVPAMIYTTSYHVNKS
jgi:hypothetical protein